MDRNAGRLLLILAVLSVIAFTAERLALHDIFHGEPDLTQEWRVVHWSWLPIVALHLQAIGVAILVSRSRRT